MTTNPNADFAEFVSDDVAYTTDAPDNIVKYFEHDHLPYEGQVVASPFYQVARFLDSTLDNGPQKSTALLKLLEGKDAAVRSALFESVD